MSLGNLQCLADLYNLESLRQKDGVQLVPSGNT